MIYGTKGCTILKKDLQKITEVFGGEHEKNFVF